jgi:hypothetical protein
MQIEDYSENYNSGWIKFFRSILNHWLWPKGKKLTYLEAWLLILLTVNHTDEKCLIGYDVIECKRGQKLYSLQSWAKLFNWSVQNIRTYFKLLEKDNMVILEGLQKTTRLTICNYESYQSAQQTSNKQVTIKQQASNKQVTTIKEYKNDNKEKNNIYFSEFWDLYDKKVGDKNSCERKWDKLKDDERKKIIEILPKWKKQFNEKQFQPYPATFLNQHRWNDEIIEPNKINLL